MTFERGLVAMREGNYASACPMLAESYRLDPLPGALFTLAECEAAWGKVASAIEDYETFVNTLTSLPPARREKFEERRRIALDKITSLAPLACELTIDVPPGGPASVVIKRNDLVVEPSSYGVSKKVDPGEYLIEAEAAGRSVWQRRVTLEQHDRARVDVQWPPPVEAAQSPLHKPASPPVDATSPARTWVYVTGGVGVAGLTMGVVTGVLAMSQKSSIDRNCPDLQCNPEGHRAVTAGKTAALVSTIAFPVGLAGVAATAILLLVPHPRAAGGGVAWRGLRPTVIGKDHGAVVAVGGAF